MAEPFALRPIQTPAAWRGSELARTDEWIYQLSPDETAEIERLVVALRRAGIPRERVTRDEVRLDGLAPAVRVWRDTLARGRGFVLVRGLPIDRMSDDDAALVYWALGLHLGTPVPQNFQGELLTDVRDVGADPTDPSTRLYKTRAEQDFHTDGADVIALLCLHSAKRGGESRIVSSITVYNEILQRRPEVALLLFRDFYWHYFEPQMPSPPISSARSAPSAAAA